jgi:hypothetical protein
MPRPAHRVLGQAAASLNLNLPLPRTSKAKPHRVPNVKPPINAAKSQPLLLILHLAHLLAIKTPETRLQLTPLSTKTPALPQLQQVQNFSLLISTSLPPQRVLVCAG